MKWAAPSSPAFVGCSLYHNAARSLTAGTTHLLAWNSEEWDTDGLHSTSVNTSRITIPSGKGGYWLFTGFFSWASSAVGYRSMTLWKNGSVISYPTSGITSSGLVTMSFSQIVSLVATDYIEAGVFQNSGGNLNLNGDFETMFQAVYLGA